MGGWAYTVLFVAITQTWPASSLLLHSSDGPRGPGAWTNMESCRRECDGVRRTCYLKLHIERFTVLGPACKKCDEGKVEDCSSAQCVTADGYQRAVITANRRVPAPPLEVCRNDTLIVDVVNQMPDLTTSIHWHGVRQTETPYSDGTPYVTQCPINPASSFRYNFTADVAGTFFYHSHTGTQKVDGLAGALIVRDLKANDIFSALYDEDLSEHVLVFNDWTHIPAEHLVPGFHSTSLTKSAKTYIINGRGKYYDDKSNITLPQTEIIVEQGKRYRIRLVGAICLSCGARVRFEGHTITAITLDGGLTFEPLKINTLLLNSGERVDIILEANKPVGTYHMTVEGVGLGCDKLNQSVMIRYKDSTNTTTSKKQADFSEKSDYNARDLTSLCDGSSITDVCYGDLNGTSDAFKIDNSEMYHQLELRFGVYVADESIFTDGTYLPYDEPIKGLYTKPYINKISFTAPPSPLISQLEDIPGENFCSDNCMKGNVSTCCTCATFYELKLNSIVDIIIVDEDALFAHPFHLHGYNFYIMEMKGGIMNTTGEVNELKERLRKDQVSTLRRPMRDTVTVPYGGYTAIRFKADNPGFWILHCHFAFHLEGGMAAVLKVGDSTDWPPVPKNFPTCRSFS